MPNCMPKAFRVDFMQYSLQACRVSILVTYLRLIEGAIKGIGVGTGGGVSHIKVTGMLVGKFKLNPQGRPMWVWLKLKLKEISVCHQCQGFFYVQY